MNTRGDSNSLFTRSIIIACALIVLRLRQRIGNHAWGATLALCILWPPPATTAHDDLGHRGPTYEVTAPVQLKEGDHRLLLSINNSETGKPTPARFSLLVDGQSYTPEALGKLGLRFVSIHVGRKQRSVVTYARGAGEVEVPLPPDARSGVVQVAKGFDCLPVEIPFTVSGTTARATATLRRWTDVQQRGWLPADEHLHYDRLDPAHDKDWLTMLAADDLTHAHFLVAKGVNLPGVWAGQFAYGKEGEGTDGQRLIRPGEEFRDSSQGHINLLGISKVIPPISTGGLAGPDMPYHYPPFFDVFQRARELGGIGGPAHGAPMPYHTAVANVVLGAVDFFEIANTGVYRTDLWYRLMNCGYITPPAAGTDLPNFPFRDPWEPFLGEMRMYVRVGQQRDFESWKQALARGEVFVTSGPMIQFTVNGVGSGGIVHLPADGGEVELQAELASPRLLQTFEIVQNSKVVPSDIRRTTGNGIHRWEIRQRVRIHNSCWLAARGEGDHKPTLEKQLGRRQNTIAHTAAVQVLVGGQPIMSPDDASRLLKQLAAQQEFYRDKGKFEKAEDRSRFLGLLDRATEQLKRRAAR